MNRPTVILDRDGVINADSDAYIKSVAEWQPLPGSIEAMARLSSAGWRVIVCTNQSGVGRGLLSEAMLTDIHDVLCSQVAECGGQVDAIFHCPHRPEDGCDCRKPRPGLLRRAAETFDLDLQNLPVIGDSQRDLDAAAAVGALPLLVRTGNGEATAAQTAHGAVAVYTDLAAAADALLLGAHAPENKDGR